jgi:hypothetical protein
LRRSNTTAEDVLGALAQTPYKSLPNKVLAMFAYAVQEGYLFTLEGDDDTYVNVPEFVQVYRHVFSDISVPF